jgi:hypothetical protein
MSQGSIFRRVKSSSGAVETAAAAEVDDIIVGPADNESVASSRQSTSGDALDEMFNMDPSFLAITGSRRVNGHTVPVSQARRDTSA